MKRRVPHVKGDEPKSSLTKICKDDGREPDPPPAVVQGTRKGPAPLSRDTPHSPPRSCRRWHPAAGPGGQPPWPSTQHCKYLPAPRSARYRLVAACLVVTPQYVTSLCMTFHTYWVPRACRVVARTATRGAAPPGWPFFGKEPYLSPASGRASAVIDWLLSPLPRIYDNFFVHDRAPARPRLHPLSMFLHDMPIFAN